ncbi:MAG: hypothetical protein NTY53_14175 [Kiritimatiellaeota bacterium]|nr:hypothetical protein [Kiritimatiellota bacterium]
MTTCPTITIIWDYGWLAGDVLELPQTDTERELIERYVASPAFHTSFLPSDKDETGIHGPFIADRIEASDFVPFKESALEQYLATLLYSPEWDSPASAEQLLPFSGTFVSPLRRACGAFS